MSMYVSSSTVIASVETTLSPAVIGLGLDTTSGPSFFTLSEQIDSVSGKAFLDVESSLFGKFSAARTDISTDVVRRGIGGGTGLVGLGAAGLGTGIRDKGGGGGGRDGEAK